MKEQLRKIMIKEKDTLENLLRLLEKQHAAVAKDSINEMNECTSLIDEASKEVARAEVERRKIVGVGNFKQIVAGFNDKEMQDSYRDIGRIIEGIKMQKESNDIMLKQKLSFTNSMLLALTPKNKKKAGVYNAYGKMKR